MTDMEIAIMIKNMARETVRRMTAENAPRYGYEWETPEKKNAKLSRMAWLRDEIKRISNTTLRGNFSKPEDREFWVDRLKKLNSELSALEEQNK